MKNAVLRLKPQSGDFHTDTTSTLSLVLVGRYCHFSLQGSSLEGVEGERCLRSGAPTKRDSRGGRCHKSWLIASSDAQDSGSGSVPLLCLWGQSGLKGFAVRFCNISLNLCRARNGLKSS